MKRAGIYIRVSTQEQVTEGYSIAAQKERLINYCKAKDWSIVNIYIDGGFSGSNIERPAMQKLISEIDKIDIVLVYKLDRLSRSQKDTLYLIEDVFLKNNVDFVSMNESFDTSTPFGRAMIGILSVFAQLERETIKERSLMGRMERAKEGYFHGGGFAPVGYDYVGRDLIINEYEAMQVRTVYDMYLKGYGVDRITSIMHDSYTTRHGSWGSHTAVTSVLDTPVYAGIITFGGQQYKGKHDPIISPDLFEKVQALRKARYIKKERVFMYKSLLGGFLFCGYCGARYASKDNRNQLKYYACYSRAKTKKYLIKDPNCKNKNWRREQLDVLVEEQVYRLAIDKKYFDEILKENLIVKKDTTANDIITKRIGEIEKQINKFMDLYQLDSIPADELGKRIQKLCEEKKNLKSQIQPTKETAPPVDIQNVIEQLANLDVIWKYADMEEKRNILKGLINKIMIYDERIEIEWSFTSVQLHRDPLCPLEPT